LTEHRQFVVLRGRIAEQLEVLLSGCAIVGFGTTATIAASTDSAAIAATVVLDGSVRRCRCRGLRIRDGPPRIMGHGVTGAPEVRRLIEACGGNASVDRSFLRDRPL